MGNFGKKMLAENLFVFFSAVELACKEERELERSSGGASKIKAPRRM